MAASDADLLPGWRWPGPGHLHGIKFEQAMAGGIEKEGSWQESLKGSISNTIRITG